MKEKRTVDFIELVDRMMEDLEMIDGDTLAECFNTVCAEKAKYLGDGQWELTSNYWR